MPCLHVNIIPFGTKQITVQTHHPRMTFAFSEQVANDQPFSSLFSHEPAKCCREQSTLMPMGMTCHIDKKPSTWMDICQGAQTQPSGTVELKFNTRMVARDHCGRSSIWLQLEQALCAQFPFAQQPSHITGLVFTMPTLGSPVWDLTGSESCRCSRDDSQLLVMDKYKPAFLLSFKLLLSYEELIKGTKPIQRRGSSVDKQNILSEILTKRSRYFPIYMSIGGASQRLCSSPAEGVDMDA
ncbi:uncharacterized protein LOC134512270 [Chroicocephalus ridibundus]|uniref:uncharacterized protein LOC134512270 n=1 Tax=Chroicocephalus ridibundus TaxID=1192867 RepID=UPI002FDDC594